MPGLLRPCGVRTSPWFLRLLRGCTHVGGGKTTRGEKSVATTSYEDALRERFEAFCENHGFSRKYVATRGIEMFIEQYESTRDDTG
jgi:hypothetical protein